jgi:hypothetical protein
MRFKSLKGFTLGKPRENHVEENKDAVGAELKGMAANRIAKMEKRIFDRTRDLENKARQIHDLADDMEKTVEKPPIPHGPIGELTVEAEDISEITAIKIDAFENNESDDDDDDEEKIKLVEISAAEVKVPAKENKAHPLEVGKVAAKQPDKASKEPVKQSKEPIKSGKESVKSVKESTSSGQEPVKPQSEPVKPVKPENLEKVADKTEPPLDKPDTEPEKPKDIKLDDSNDSLDSLFSQDEEEVNPLANLINSLPDVSAQEIIDDLNEIKRIIKEWHPK